MSLPAGRKCSITDRTAIALVDTISRVRIWLGVVLLVAGFLGHIFAAQAIGGTRLAYRDHILGFVGLSLVSGAIIAGLGWRGYLHALEALIELSQGEGTQLAPGGHV